LGVAPDPSLIQYEATPRKQEPLQFSEAIRDPVHGLIRLEKSDLHLIDSMPIQRLRSIAQLGLTDRVYPGACHSRFEHALGTMEVTTRLLEEMKSRLGLEELLRPLSLSVDEGSYVDLLRIARNVALLHDLGHPPFSHVTERLLPRGMHEEMSLSLLEHPQIAAALLGQGHEIMTSVAHVMDPAKSDLPSHLRFVRSLVCGEFGSDRMDYLLRDAHHVGVEYGAFDLPRIQHTLRPLETDQGVQLGIEAGGLLAAEGLQWARFSMFTQVYFHRTRRILDLHLVDFLVRTLHQRRYPEEPEEYLRWDDIRVFQLLREADADSSHPGHSSARKIIRREQHRALPEVVEGQDTDEVADRLATRVREIRNYEPQRDPLADVVAPPPSLTKGGDLPVLLKSGEIRRLSELSSLVGRLRVKPHGRIYCARG